MRLLSLSLTFRPRKAQTRAISDRQRGLVLVAGCCAQQAADLVQHDRPLARMGHPVQPAG